MVEPTSVFLSSRFTKAFTSSLFLLLIIFITYLYNPNLSFEAVSEVQLDHNSHRHLEENDNKVKPILYTYIDESEKTFDKELLELWRMYWGKSGWDTHILTPAVAKEHPDYEEFDTRLTAAGICCLPKMTYLRHLAMAVIKSGGYYSEYYVFPLQKASVDKNEDGFQTLPNDGRFTAYDGAVSFLSGSNLEWNRIVKLLMENIERNDFLSLRKIRHIQPDAYMLDNTINTPYGILNTKQFRLDICGEFSKQKVGIRFHPAEIQDLKYNVTTDRTGLIKSWMRVYEGRCLSNRPVIFTFYEPVDYLQYQDPGSLLEAWKEAWSNAGFQPIVLSLQDSKRHPNYKHILPMLDGIQFKGGNDKFNFLCFLRWVAVSNSGGGWMADYDTFPLNIEPSFTLPNNGKFTVHAGMLPTLVSGSASEWNQMARLIFTNYREKSNIVTSWSDFLALKQIHAMDNKTFLVEYNTTDLYNFYIEDIKVAKSPGLETPIPDIFDLKEKCSYKDTKKAAIHFLHYRYEKYYKDRTNLDRTEFVKKWHQTWIEQCKEQ